MQEGDNRSEVLAGEGTVPHLPGGLLSDFVQLVRDIIAVPEGILNKPVDWMVDGTREQFIHWSDDCYTISIRRLLETFLLACLVCFWSKFVNMRLLRVFAVIMVAIAV